MAGVLDVSAPTAAGTGQRGDSDAADGAKGSTGDDGAAGVWTATAAEWKPGLILLRITSRLLSTSGVGRAGIGV